MIQASSIGQEIPEQTQNWGEDVGHSVPEALGLLGERVLSRFMKSLHDVDAQILWLEQERAVQRETKKDHGT